MLKLVILAHIFYIALSYRGNFIASYWLGIKLVGNYSSRQEINGKQQCTCVLIKCCLTLWCKCECSKRLEAGQERSERTARASYVNWTVLRTTTRGTESVHWYSSIWPADNGDVTGVKTAVPLRIVLARKARGPPALCLHSAWLSWWANESSSPMSHSCGHFLAFFLAFLSFPWLSVLFHRGGCQRGHSVRWQCPACHRHPHTYTVQRRAGSENSRASFPITHSNRNSTFPFCVGSDWEF